MIAFLKCDCLAYLHAGLSFRDIYLSPQKILPHFNGYFGQLTALGYKENAITKS